MKKLLKYEIMLLAALLVIALVVRLASCGAGDPTEVPPTTEAPQVTTTAPAPQITWKTFPETRQLTARQAFVYDCQTQEFGLLAGAPTDRVYAASITKLFTAYVALQHLTPEQTVTAGDVLDLVGAGSSVAEIQKGDVLTVAQLVEAMLLPSGNDAAYILAAEVGWKLQGDTSLSASRAVDLFVEEMNRQAKALGMTGTQFMNPDGYHTDSHYTNFNDLVTIAKVSLENPTVLQYAAVSLETVTFQNGTQQQWKNTNALVDPGSGYYCPLAVGLKTGQTPSAGSCLLSAFQFEGNTIIIGVFGCPDVDTRFEDTLQLLNDHLEQNYGYEKNSDS